MLELLGALESSAFATWVREASTIWAYPTILTLHTVGLAVLVGANAAFDLRVLGVGRQIPLAPIEWLFPAMWVGFGLNAITGAMLFSADPIEKGTTALFMAKLTIVVAGVVLIPLLRRAVYRPGRAAIAVTPLAKTFAALSLFVWTAATVTGRWMAYW